jgi:hypothetical protein
MDVNSNRDVAGAGEFVILEDLENDRKTVQLKPGQTLKFGKYAGVAHNDLVRRRESS